MSRTVGFIGAGNMAEGIIKGLLCNGGYAGSQLFIREALLQREEYMTSAYGVTPVKTLAELVKKAEILVLAVRPQDAEVISKELGQVIQENIVVSICAGIQIPTLRGWIGERLRYARIMPNTMISSARGYSALAFDRGFSAEDEAEVRRLTDAIGKTMPLAEEKFDAFTASSCAGPEWIILYAQALIDAGVETGLSREEAQKIVWENLEATGIVLSKQEKHPFAITDGMNTPGGIGIAGFHSFARAGLTGIVMDAVGAAYKRTTELG